MSNQQDRMAHHIVQHAAALQIAAPEPRLVGAAVLFGGSRKIGTSRQRSTSIPEDLTTDINRRREDLIFEIPMAQVDASGQIQNPFRLGNVSGKRFLASQALE